MKWFTVGTLVGPTVVGEVRSLTLSYKAVARPSVYMLRGRVGGARYHPAVPSDFQVSSPAHLGPPLAMVGISPPQAFLRAAREGLLLRGTTAPWGHPHRGGRHQGNRDQQHAPEAAASGECRPETHWEDPSISTKAACWLYLAMHDTGSRFLARPVPDLS